MQAIIYFWITGAFVIGFHASRFARASPDLVFDTASLLMFSCTWQPLFHLGMDVLTLTRVSVTSFCILVHWAR